MPRYLNVTICLFIGLLLGEALTPIAFAESHERQIGPHARGVYYINGDPVRFFAMDYRGGANARDGQAAYNWAIDNLRGDTGLVEQQEFWSIRRSDRRIILGYYNEERREGGWIVIQHKDDNTAHWRDNNGNKGEAPYGRWNDIGWRANGGTAKVRWGVDGEGRGITWSFHVSNQ
jgi:hypothetical protein